MKCEMCENEFSPKNNLQKYCCKECKLKSNTKVKLLKISQLRKESFDKQNNKRICPVCNNEFVLKQQHITQIYCCSSCRKKAERLFGNKREIDLEYKNKIRYGGNQFKVLERDNYTCQLCGNKLQLIVHHKDKSGQSNNPNNNIDNLITLCRRCHINIHKF